MKGRPIEKLVYETLFPKPRSSEPPTFQAFLTRSLIPEVRQETQAFYGHIDTQEAKYPGLDYNHPTHRIRLQRWSSHRKLFRAFDALGLTPAEISQLTRWEGTKWAKEKFEQEQGITIRDTTADDIPTWNEVEQAVAWVGRREVDESISGDLEVKDDEEEDDNIDAHDENMIDEVDALEEEDSDGELESVGIELNERLRAVAARREAGEHSAVLDEEWEQWLKNAVESGILSDTMTEQTFRQLFESTVVPAGLLPVGMVSAARAGLWSTIPEFLHPLVRRALEAEQPRAQPHPRGEYARFRQTPPPPPPRRVRPVDGPMMGTWSARRSYSDLRLPVGESGSIQRAA